MNKTILVFLLFALTLSVSGHDMRMAQFTVHVEKGQLICDSRIDKEDFENAIDGEVSQEEVERYLKSHLVFKFNESDVDFSLLSYELKKNVIAVRFSMKTSNYNPTEIEVMNTVLLEEVDGHDNIMRFVLHDKTRTFRFTEKRKTISFNY